MIGIFKEIHSFKVSLYCSLLDECIIRDPEGLPIIPELYAVPADRVNSAN
jgi:hypothetical protein